MELEELLDTQLQHVGVKGMKWGVRKSRTSKDRASETTPKPKSTVRKHIDSNKREVGMRKMVKDIDGLPDSEIQRRVNRVRNENDLRRAIDDTTFLDGKRKKVLRAEYLDRKNLSDDELQKRVSRVKLEDKLRREMGTYKVPKDVTTLPDAEVIRRTNRVRNENDLLRAINKATFLDGKRTKPLREDYYNRKNLSDDELQKRVRRMKLEDNLRREMGTYKVAKDVATLPDAEVIRRTNRVRNENDLFRAINKATSLDGKRKKTLREGYYNRKNLSDDELQKIVSRVKLEDNLRREVVRASKPQREAANEFIKSVSTHTLDKYTDPKTKVFSATGNAEHDAYIHDALKYTKSNKIVPEKYGKK